MIQQITTLYKYGFKYKSVVYGWKNKKLYKLPYVKNNRSYKLKQIPLNCFKSTLVVNIQREKLTINKLKRLTFEINQTVVLYVDDGIPF